MPDVPKWALDPLAARAAPVPRALCCAAAARVLLCLVCGVNYSASKRLYVGGCCNCSGAHALAEPQLPNAPPPGFGLFAISEQKMWSALGGALEVPIWAS
jgi:hypothetical protein